VTYLRSTPNRSEGKLALAFPVTRTKAYTLSRSAWQSGSPQRTCTFSGDHHPTASCVLMDPTWQTSQLIQASRWEAMSYPLEFAVVEVDRMSVDFLSYSATASSMVVVVDALVSMVVIVRKRPSALEVVVTPSQNLDTPVLVYHDMSEGTIVVLTTSLECCQR
jgi:hypothetical protein